MARPDHVVSELVVRAPLAADIASDKFDLVLGVSISATGKATIGAAGQTGFIGVVCPSKTLSKAGQPADIHRIGDLVDCVGLAAGTKYYLANDGTLSATATAGRVYVGYTVEADRLVLCGFGGTVAP